jgi:hypothetical protein
MRAQNKTQTNALIRRGQWPKIRVPLERGRFAQSALLPTQPWDPEISPV